MKDKNSLFPVSEVDPALEPEARVELKAILAELRYLRADVTRVLNALPSAPRVPTPPLPVEAELSSPPTEVPVSLSPRRGLGGVLAVQCLGGFHAWLDEQPLEFGRSRKGQSLFRFLVTHGGGPVPRELLMDMLWPGVSQAQARHRLNMAVYSLRHGLQQTPGQAEGCILYTEGAYLINPALNLRVDADQFLAAFHRAEAALTAGDLVQALADYELADRLYVGDYLPEERYADWAHLTQQRLEDAHNTSLIKLSRLYLGQGDYRRADETVQRVLAVDPCYEDGHRLLMCCYARTGHRTQALRQFLTCVQVLKTELGVEPSEQTRRLAEQIRNAEPV